MTSDESDALAYQARIRQLAYRDAAVRELVEVARARVRHWHSVSCPNYPFFRDANAPEPERECTCGHDDLCAALVAMEKEAT